MTQNLKASPSSRSKDARALRSGAALRDALLELLQAKPFDQVTIRDICAAAGVHYATYFRHHPTKEALLDEIAKKEIQQLIVLTLAIRNDEDYDASFRALCRYVDDHRRLWTILLNGGAGSAMREEWLRQSQAVAAIESPANRWLPSDLGTICAATIIAESLAWWVRQPLGVTGVDEMAVILRRLLLGAIIAPD